MAKKRISRPLRKLRREAIEITVPLKEELKISVNDSLPDEDISISLSIHIWSMAIGSCLEGDKDILDVKEMMDACRDEFYQWTKDYSKFKYTCKQILAWIKVYDYFLECEGLKVAPLNIEPEKPKKKRKSRSKKIIEFPSEFVQGKLPEPDKCGLCGKAGNLTKTDCCDTWICNDLDKPKRESCYLSHEYYTLCGYHYHSEHKGNWKDCKKCEESFDYGDYVWYVTNDYNIEKLEELPQEPNYKCEDCGKKLYFEMDVIKKGDALLCFSCMEKKDL